jgi:hypothetical protein
MLRREISNWKFQISNEAKAKRKNAKPAALKGGATKGKSKKLGSWKKSAGKKHFVPQDKPVQKANLGCEKQTYGMTGVESIGG